MFQDVKCAGRGIFRGIRVAGWGLPLVAIVALLGGCDALDELIGVDAPSRVLAEDVGDPANASLLVNSAGADFECALSHYIVAGGLVGNELEVGTTLIAWKDYDRRIFDPSGAAYTSSTCNASGTGSVGVYIPLSVARWQADNALELLEGWTDEEVPGRAELIATAAAFSGYSHVLLAEGMCSAAFDLGPELLPPEIFERAENRFTRAIEAAELAGTADILSLARVGRARARLGLGNTAAAAEDARLVPDGFHFDATYSTASSRRENNVFRAIQGAQVVTVDPSYRNRTFEGVPDTRIAIEDTGGPTQDGTTALWHQLKYPTPATSIPMATWEEARLIVAEAELEAGNVDEAAAIIDDLHSRADLPPFDSDDPDEVMQQLLLEREAELFLESHHLADLKRYDLPLLPPPGSPFKDGGTYGDLTCFPLPDVERLNNPNIS